jgi:hypothetical protein
MYIRRAVIASAFRDCRRDGKMPDGRRPEETRSLQN